MGTAKQIRSWFFSPLSIFLGFCLAFICAYCVYKQFSNQLPIHEATHSGSNQQIIAIKQLFANFENKQIEFWCESKLFDEVKRSHYQVWIGRGDLREVRRLPDVQRENDDMLIWWEQVLHRDGLSLNAIYTKIQKMEPDARIINAAPSIQAQENWKSREMSPHHSLFLGLFWNGQSNADLKSDQFWENANINYESDQSFDVIHTNGAKFSFDFDPSKPNQLRLIRGNLPSIPVLGPNRTLFGFELSLEYKADSNAITAWKETTDFQIDGQAYKYVQNFQITDSKDWIRDKQNLELEFENVKNGARVWVTVPRGKDGEFEYRDGRVARVDDK